MPEEITSDVMLRVKLTVALSILIGLAAGAASAVNAVYRLRDGLVTTETQQRNEALKNYPTRQELWQDITHVSHHQDQQYTDLKDRIDAVQGKVDGIVIYLRKKL